jgi:hypothetical protein
MQTDYLIVPAFFLVLFMTVIIVAGLTWSSIDENHQHTIRVCVQNGNTAGACEYLKKVP